MSIYKQCKHCGSRIYPDERECPNCGSQKFEQIELDKPKPEPVITPTSTPVYSSPWNTPNKPIVHTSHLKNIISGIIGLAVFIGIIILVATLINNAINPYSDTTTYQMNKNIQTDWFHMKVTNAKIIRGSFGGLGNSASGNERLLVEVFLDNHLLDEDLDIHLNTDFYIETRTEEKIFSQNTGGDYNTFDKLGSQGLFYSTFMVSPGRNLLGYIVYDIPKNSTDVCFVYEEWEWDGDVRVEVKHYYKVELRFGDNLVPFTAPTVPAGDPAEFETLALSAGYVIEIEADYDGFDTLWIGAHKFADEGGSASSKTTRPEPLFLIDFTLDKTINNAKAEYNIYIGDISSIGGVKKTGGSPTSSYQYQTNTSSTKFGVAYRIESANIYIVADIQYKNEILDFLSDLSYQGISDLVEDSRV